MKRDGNLPGGVLAAILQERLHQPKLKSVASLVAAEFVVFGQAVDVAVVLHADDQRSALGVENAGCRPFRYLYVPSKK